jgi:methyl-accepting chemotaxis protein
MLKNISIKKKLLGAFFVSSLITAIVGGIGLVQIKANSKVINKVTADDVVFLTGALKLNQLALQHRRYEKNFFINIGNKENQDQDLESFNAVASESQELVRTLEVAIPADADEVEEIKASFTAAVAAHEKYMKGFLDIAARVQADPGVTPQTGNAMMDALAGDIEVYETSVNTIADLSLLYIASVSEKVAADAKKSQILIAALLAAGIAISIVFGFVISGLITRPLREAVRFAKAMANGDFTMTLPDGGKDEVGALLMALSQMTDQLKTMIGEIIGYVNTLSSASTELSSISEQLSEGAKATADKSLTVSSSTEQVSSSITSIAAASEEATTNVNMVATAAEEMTATINEIAANTETARGITTDAVVQAETASGQVEALGKSAQEISRVVEAITEISEQVNLLALNATIEAARAGEAGKGFAVVANEIKELARQTASAAITIRQQIGSVQQSSRETVEGITSFAGVVSKVNEIVSSIAAAIEEQTAVTREIVGNVAYAASGINDVSQNIIVSSSAVVDISQQIGEVRGNTENISASSDQVNTSALELSRLSEQIKSLVERFRV